MSHKIRAYTLSYIVTVYAHNEEEATEMAYEDIDLSMPDYITVDEEDTLDCAESPCYYEEEEETD